MKKNNLHTIQLKDYAIFVGTGLLEHIGSVIKCDTYSSALIITGNKTPTVFTQKVRTSIPLRNSIFQLPGGEKNKNIQSVQRIWKALHDFDCNKNSLVINLGGGVITDIGGFSASTYLKGINFLNIPTTLLGQVDASNGGKTGINFDNTKNLIGSFQSPIGVIADIGSLSSLPKREFISGFGEIIKHGLIMDQKYFQFVTSKPPQAFTQDELIRIVATSCDIKARIVMKDVKELGQGRILGFGHTFGHAIEVLSQRSAHPVLHGEAVIAGMMVEVTISHLLNFLSEKDSDTIKRELKKFDVPEFVSTVPIPDILKTLQSHNRYADGILRCTLLKGIGHAVVNIKVPNRIVVTALQQTKKL